MKILIIGVTGMLGGSLLRYFSNNKHYDVYGTVRDRDSERKLVYSANAHIVSDMDVLDFEKIRNLIEILEPEYVLNCVGIVKQLKESNSPVHSISINSLLPHQLAEVCTNVGAKLIHFSTDCVFSGKQGNYSVADIPDALDLYGRSKFLGEVNYDHHLTLRTSIIGHEQGSKHSLVDWFLNQSTTVKGFKKAVFSGIPTVYMGEVLERYVFTNPEINGLYHLSVEPIDKFTLLSMIKNVYGKDINILEDDNLVIDRTLNSNEFKAKTGMVNPTWIDLIEKMHDEYKRYFKKA